MGDGSSAKILRDTANLAEFFGCSLSKVDGDLIRIARLKTPPPDWLRGKSKMAMLPRYLSRAEGDRCVVEITSGVAYAERLVWVIDNLSSSWMTLQSGVSKTFVFVEGSDAMHFRLRWGIEA